MLSDLVISVDSTTTMPKEQIDEYGVISTSLTYVINGEEYFDDFSDELGKAKVFDLLKDEDTQATSKGVSPKHFMTNWKPVLAEGKTILHLSISSGVSGAYQSACLAADALNAVYMDKVTVLDTLSGGVCVAKMAIEAAKMYRSGKTLSDIVRWLEEEKYYYNMLLCVDDITHAKNEGVISAFKAAIGSAIGIKPVLYVAPQGNTEMLGLSRGLKNSYNLAADIINEVKTDATTWVAIEHAGDEYNALAMVEILRNKIKQIKSTEVGVMSPVLGINGGPGLVALYFKAKNRDYIRAIVNKMKKK